MIANRPVVLVVQDANAQGSAETGASQPCLTLRTSQADSGYEMARARRPDLVAIDVSVGGGTGWALCRLLKRDPLTASIPVVMLAAVNSPETTAHARCIGALGVFSDPTAVAEWLLATRVALPESSAA